MKKRLAAGLLSAILVVSTAASAGALSVEDTRALLEEYYAGPLRQEVLEQQSVEDMLSALGDPYTEYLSAEAYQAFLQEVDGQQITGIGVAVESKWQDGYRIDSVLPDSPAEEAGLQSGDRIVEVDGIPMTADVSSTEYLGGEAGSSVTVTVVRAGERLTVTMTRRAVTVPIVIYGRDGNAGIFLCDSFGESTPVTFFSGLMEIGWGTTAWIVDLRSNGGGTIGSAGATAGLFIGPGSVVTLTDGQEQRSEIGNPGNYPDMTDRPAILLLNEYSASATELFAAAMRDYHAGIAIGSRTYGKGVAQIVLDETVLPRVFDGDALKITAYRFYSPAGVANHLVGVLPTLMVDAEYVWDAALLLTTPECEDSTGFFRVIAGGDCYYIDRNKAMEKKEAFSALLEAIPPTVGLYRGLGGENWERLTPTALAAELKLPLNPRTFSDIAHVPQREAIETLAAYGMVGGYADGTFRPNAFITRGQFAKMLSAALNLSADADGVFSDVPADAWCAPYAAALREKGIMLGFEDGTFRPDAPMTREQMSRVLSAAAAWCNLESRGVEVEAAGSVVTRAEAAQALQTMLEPLLWE